MTTRRKLKGSQYPHMEFDGDTWRKKSFFKEALDAHQNNDSDAVWKIVKRVWIDFIISIDSERVRMRQQNRLTSDYLEKIAHDNCPCCGSAMWYGRVHNFVEGYRKPSLDRINKDGGYINENVWIICNKCNTRKSDATNPLELIQLGLVWYNQEKKKLDEYKQYLSEIPSLSQYLE
jgi:hypothetical protein